jgi:YD repeat-containing protein
VDKVTLPSGPQSSTLGYDAARRPISLTLQSGGSLSQAYDRAGNRLTKIEGSTTFTYQYRRTGGISHVQETGQGSQFFVHDAYGNLTADSQSGVSTTSYTYDARNELVAITPPSGPVATFTRDALGRLKERTLSTSPTATTDTYGYVGTSETVFEIVTSGGSSSTTRGAIGVDGTRLAVRTSTTSFTLADLHGSIAGLFAATPTSVADAYRIKDLGVSRTQIGVAPAGPPDHRRRGRSGGGHIRLRP